MRPYPLSPRSLRTIVQKPIRSKKESKFFSGNIHPEISHLFARLPKSRMIHHQLLFTEPDLFFFCTSYPFVVSWQLLDRSEANVTRGSPKSRCMGRTLRLRMVNGCMWQCLVMDGTVTPLYLLATNGPSQKLIGIELCRVKEVPMIKTDSETWP